MGCEAEYVIEGLVAPHNAVVENERSIFFACPRRKYKLVVGSDGSLN